MLRLVIPVEAHGCIGEVFSSVVFNASVPL